MLMHLNLFFFMNVLFMQLIYLCLRFYMYKWMMIRSIININLLLKSPYEYSCFDQFILMSEFKNG